MAAPRERYLSLIEVAELMKLPHETPEERRQYVRRLVRRLEQRDGTVYLRRFGVGQGKLFIAVSAVEQLMPWDPGTLTSLRGELHSLNAEVRAVKKRVSDNARRISNLEKFRDLTRRYLIETAQLTSDETLQE